MRFIENDCKYYVMLSSDKEIKWIKYIIRYVDNIRRYSYNLNNNSVKNVNQQLQRATKYWEYLSHSYQKGNWN